MRKKHFLFVLPILFIFACTPKEPKLPDVIDTGIVGKMIKVQGGKFMMGCADCEVDESPVREVTLSTFYIAEFEVIQEQCHCFHYKDNHLFLYHLLPQIPILLR